MQTIWQQDIVKWLKKDFLEKQIKIKSKVRFIRLTKPLGNKFQWIFFTTLILQQCFEVFLKLKFRSNT